MHKILINLIKIEAPDSFLLTELKTRAIESPKSIKTTHYRALSDGKEVAFVSLDRWPEPEFNQMVIYEIYVPVSSRRKGIGRTVLTEIERIAEKEGFERIRLRPFPLNQEISYEDLTGWYIRRGYNWDPVITGEMEKALRPGP